MNTAKRNQLMDELEELRERIGEMEDEDELEQLTFALWDLQAREREILAEFPEVRYWPG